MNDNEIKEDDPLIVWNEDNKESTVKNIVVAMYISIAETTKNVDQFSLWLLAGTGATGALLITQIDSVLPHLTADGFKVSMTFLVASAISGFFAKYRSLMCEIQIQMLSRLDEMVKPIVEKHQNDKKEIEEYASQRKMKLQTSIPVIEMLKEYAKPFPFWIKWMINRMAKKTKFDKQTSYHKAIKSYLSQLQWTLLQGIFFIIFLVNGAWYASAI